MKRKKRGKKTIKKSKKYSTKKKSTKKKSVAKKVKKHSKLKKSIKKAKKPAKTKNPALDNKIKSANNKILKIKEQMNKVVIGQEKVINDLFICTLCNGSAILEGVPGIAKTLIINALATAIDCKFKRIQFTADLLPTDITGFEAYSREKGFFTVKGPIFTNFVLADEINRAPPKVQSAMIEAMQERQVTISRKTYYLDEPFIVFATENPLESRGVYKLPEAQVDRFLFKIIVGYPSKEEEELIMEQNISLKKFQKYHIKKVAKPEDIIELQDLVKKIYMKPEIKKYIAEIVSYTRNNHKNKLTHSKYIAWGASPRASINLYIASKARALMEGRSYVTPQDVKDVAYNILRHRILLNYEGEVNKISSEKIIDEILAKVEVP